MGDKHSIPADTSADYEICIEDHDFIPDFQRVSISGEDTSGVPLEDLEKASRLVIQALELRERYMDMSQQTFPTTTTRFLKSVHEKNRFDHIEHEDRKTIAGQNFSKICNIFVIKIGLLLLRREIIVS